MIKKTVRIDKGKIGDIIKISLEGDEKYYDRTLDDCKAKVVLNDSRNSNLSCTLTPIGKEDVLPLFGSDTINDVPAYCIDNGISAIIDGVNIKIFDSGEISTNNNGIVGVECHGDSIVSVQYGKKVFDNLSDTFHVTFKKDGGYDDIERDFNNITVLSTTKYIINIDDCIFFDRSPKSIYFIEIKNYKG